MADAVERARPDPAAVDSIGTDFYICRDLPT
jgi:hypothetical protein